MATINSGATVLVTGASGFVGSHVADALSDAGYKVRLFDRYESPWRRPDQSMYVGDLLNRDDVRAAARGCDAIYHYAAIADIGEAGHDPVRTAQVNIIGCLELLEAARENLCKRFVFASTVYVFSREGGFYRAAKQSCERFIETYQERFGLDFTILRYGTLYGRRAGMTNRIRAMVYDALRNKRINHPGSGESLREFIHVTDAARLSVRILSDEFSNRHYLLTGQEKLHVREVAMMIREILSEDIVVEFEEGEAEGHYALTPYAFSPPIGHKLVPSDFVDFGQGLRDCIEEQYVAEDVEQKL